MAPKETFGLANAAFGCESDASRCVFRPKRPLADVCEYVTDRYVGLPIFMSAAFPSPNSILARCFKHGTPLLNATPPKVETAMSIELETLLRNVRLYWSQPRVERLN